MSGGQAGWRTLDGQPPQIIAHRGASGVFPEHTLAGYQRGLDDGADLIEPDLLPSRDGVLFCRHDLGLARSTDIARREEFAGRARAGDWPCYQLDATEIDRLRAVQPFAGRSSEHDGRYPPPRFAAMLDWAAAQAAQRGCPLVLYPEIKHPALLRAQGVDPLPLFVAAAQRVPAGVQLRLQCFDVEALRALAAATGLPCALLLDSRGDPWQALAQHGDWLHGLALSKKLLHGEGGRALLAAAHQRGLRVDAWTFRDDQVGEGFADIAAELRWAFQLGIDALFCDYPATAVALRAQWAD